MTIRPRILKGAYSLAEEIDWEAAYKEYLPRVYNFFRYRVGDRALAEDLTAATFEKAWRGRSRFRHDLSAFSTWLFTILYWVDGEVMYHLYSQAFLPVEELIRMAESAQ